MIEFQKIKYKNILSTGNTYTELDLNSHKSTLIIGANGSGKSTVLCALTFALYGHPFRKINKPQLTNSINGKNLVVDLDFKVDSDQYKIIRGMKPNKFEIYRNGDLINQDSSSKDYQRNLEENILKMNFKSFSQIVVLGTANYVPFMELPAHSRREVIEDLLDIQVFSTMNTLLKGKISESKEIIQDKTSKLELLKSKIESAKKHNRSIQEMRDTERKRLETLISDYEENINDLQEQIDKLDDEIENTNIDTNSLTKSKNEIQSLDKYKYKIEVNRKSLVKELHFYRDNDNCPTCKQTIEQSFKEETMTNREQKIDEIDLGLETLERKHQEIIEFIQEIESQESELKKIIQDRKDLRSKINIYRRNIKSIEDEITKAQEDNVDTIDTKELTTKYNRDIDILNKEIEHREVMNITALMLKDSGIKSQVIKQYVPVINKYVNSYLSALDFFVEFTLDETFQEKILSRYRDNFSYNSFSEGEKFRINIALILTWRAVSKLRNSVSTNLLFMDEVFDSSLDETGTDEFLKIIRDITDDSNIIIISHKGDALLDKFDRTLRVQKVKGFSVIEEIQS